MKRFVHWLLKKIWIVAVVLIVLLAVFMTLARFLTPWLAHYKPQIETWASEQLHMPVKIGGLETTMHGFMPMFELDSVQVFDQDSDQSLLEVDQLYLSVNPLESLLQKRFVPGRLIISGASFSVIQEQDGSFEIKGIPQKDSTQEEGAKLAFLGKLLRQPHIRLQDIAIDFYEKDGDLIKVSDLDVDLINKNDHHRLASHIMFEQPAQSQLTLLVEFDGDLTDRANLTGKFFIGGEKLALKNWLALFPETENKLKTGRADLQWTGRIENGKLTRLNTTFAAQDLQFRDLGSEEAPFVLNQADGSIAWVVDKEDEWFLSGRDINLIINDQVWPSDQFSLKLSKNDLLERQKILVYFKYLRLDDLTPLLKVSSRLSEQNSVLLKTLNPKGELQEFHGAFQRESGVWGDYSVGLQFQDLSFDPWKKIPGVAHFSGEVSFDEGAGTADLQSEQAVLHFVHLFRQTLNFDVLGAHINWQRKDDGIAVDVPMINTTTKLGHSRGAFSLKLPFNGESPSIELFASARMQNITKEDVYQYVPVKFLSQAVTDWVDHAVLGVDALNAKVVLRGPLNSFPFDQHEGKFAVEANYEGATLDYYEHWPRAEDLTGNLQFSGRDMKAHVISGDIVGASINNMDAEIPYIGKEHPLELALTGQASGDMLDGLHFIKQSPLHHIFGGSLKGLTARGPMALDLKLHLPIYNAGKNTMLLEGKVLTEQGALAYPDWGFSVSDIKGTVNFTEESVDAKSIQAVLFDSPITASIDSTKKEDKDLLVHLAVDGSVNVEALGKAYKLPLDKVVKGSAEYDATLSVQSGQDTQIRINSDLQGLSINLPDPLGKKEDDIVLSSLDVVLSSDTPVKFKIDYGDRFNTALMFNSSEKGLAFERGELLLGDDEANWQSQPGLMIKGELEALSLSDWAAFFKEKSEGVNTRSAAAPTWLRGLDLMINRLVIGDYEFEQTEVKLLLEDKQSLLGFKGGDVEGEIRLPHDLKQYPIIADFKKLYIAAPAGEDKKTTLTLSPNDVPAFNISCEDFRYDNKNLGHIQLNVLHEENALVLDRFTASKKSFDLLVTGRWDEMTGKNKTTLNAQLTSHDLEKTLEALDIPDNIESDKAKFTFNLTWPNPPYRLDMEALAGHALLSVHPGRITGLSHETDAKVGLVRLATVLSLQSFPKRLQLNFKDLTHKGFAFDAIKGEFRLEGGNAYTDDAHLDGTAASMAMKGRIGYVDKDYDLLLTVTPHITSSLPVVATIAGGPVAGIVTWVVDKAVSSEVDKMVSYAYEITGPWSDPQVNKQ